MMLDAKKECLGQPKILQLLDRTSSARPVCAMTGWSEDAFAVTRAMISAGDRLSLCRYPRKRLVTSSPSAP